MSNISFKDFVLDQLRDVEEFECKKIPEGYGLYWGPNFFGIVSGDKLFFRTNAQTAKSYVEAGMQAYPSGKASLKCFYQVPAYILDSHEDIAEWVRTAMAS